MVGSVWPMAWRWQRLLAARGVHDSLRWLVRSYFVGYAAGQILPTSLGGDASRIYETSRRHEGTKGAAAGTVLLERALGGTATLVLAAVGFALAVGHYDVGGYLWVELAFVVAAVFAGVLLFTTRLHWLLHRLRPVLRWLRIERPLREVYIAVHSFRSTPRLLVSMFALTLVVQAVRVLAIWCAGKSVGVDLSPRPYYVMGPLLFLVMLVPFTRERVRSPRVVLRLLSRRARRVGRPCVRDGLPLLRRHDRAVAAGSRDRRVGGAARRSARAGTAMSDVSVVVVTYNGLPWIEQALESVHGVETVLVDNGSTDGTVAFVRERFPDVVVIEQENRGLAAGWNAGIARTSGRYVLLLNSDAWLDDGALAALVSFADAHPRAAVVGPRLRNPDGSLQRSVRGFPTLWRLATEYLYLRKLAPRSRAFNAFYGAGFAHDEIREAEFLMGAVWLVRRAAIDEVGPADEQLLSLQRRGRLGVSLPSGRLDVGLLSGCRRDARVRRVARRDGCSSRTSAGTCGFSPSIAAPTYAERARVLLRLLPEAPQRAHSRRARPDVRRGGCVARVGKRRRS